MVTVTAEYVQGRLKEVAAALGEEIGLAEKQERDRVDAIIAALEARVSELEEQATMP